MWDTDITCIRTAERTLVTLELTLNITAVEADGAEAADAPVPVLARAPEAEEQAAAKRIPIQG